MHVKIFNSKLIQTISILLLVSMLILSIIIFPEIGAETDTIEEESLVIDTGQFSNLKTALEKKETPKQVRIVKHKISSLELEKMKQEIEKARK